MAKYMILYRSSVPSADQMANMDPEAAKEGMELWMNWAGRVGGAMADMGSPVGTVGSVTSSGATADTPSGPFVCGFSVLEGDSVEAVNKLLDDHPHLHSPGQPSIEILEFLPVPGM